MLHVSISSSTDECIVAILSLVSLESNHGRTKVPRMFAFLPLNWIHPAFKAKNDLQVKASTFKALLHILMREWEKMLQIEFSCRSI